MKYELGRNLTKFVGVRAKTYSYLINDGSENKKANDTKRCVIKKNLSLKIIKTVQKQLNLRMKQITQKKIKLTQTVLKKS